MTVLVLDAQALNVLASGADGERRVRAALTAAVARRSPVVVPAVVLAELYRGGRFDQRVDACLARQGGIRVQDTDRALARRVGHVLAIAIAGGGSVVLTGDPKDLPDSPRPTLR